MKAWSYSFINAYEICPRKLYAERYAKTVKETKSAAGDYGIEAHKHFENFLLKDKALPLDLRSHVSVLERLKKASGEGHPEQKLAVNRDFEPTGFFDSDAWCRGIVDYAKTNPPKAMIIDWKFGRKHDDTRQVRLCAALLMAHMPEVDSILAGYYWAKEKDVEQRITRTLVYRLDLPTVWAEFLPLLERIDRSEQNDDWPAKPNFLCRRHCGVKGCEFHGK
jgi:CRISPR/Cas system-associated exonuclease Cas4 (RecB family)